MKYEVKKVFFDKNYLFIVLIAALVNIISIVKICNFTNYNYGTIYNTQADIDAMKDDIKYNILTKQNVELMEKIDGIICDRQYFYNAYDSREKEYIEFDFSFVLIVLVIILTVKSIENERHDNMIRILYTTSKCNNKMIVNKHISNWIGCFTIVCLFEIINCTCFVLLGGVEVWLPLYVVPGYVFSWFGGNILLYKLLETVTLFIVSVIISEVTYGICILFRGEIINTILSLLAVIGLFEWSKRLIYFSRALNPFTLLKPGNFLSSCYYFSLCGENTLAYTMTIGIAIMYCVLITVFNLIVSFRRQLL